MSKSNSGYLKTKTKKSPRSGHYEKNFFLRLPLASYLTSITQGIFHLARGLERGAGEEALELGVKVIVMVEELRADPGGLNTNDAPFCNKPSLNTLFSFLNYYKL